VRERKRKQPMNALKTKAVITVVCWLILCIAAPAWAGFDIETKLSASDGAAADFFGMSVAISGGTAIVGSRNDDGAGGGSGSAYLYRSVSTVPLDTSAIYAVQDNDSDAVFDDLGDLAVNASFVTRRGIGEGEFSSKNQINRLVAKFALPDAPEFAPVLDSATLRFFLEDIQGTPAGPLSLFHSATDNDLEMLASDYENLSYIDTLLDLIHSTDAQGQFYELDVTDLVLADYAADGANPLSAFRLQINEAVFFEDDQSNRYRLTMPGSVATANHPELVLTFVTAALLVPEPSTLTLTALALLGLLAHGRRCRA